MAIRILQEWINFLTYILSQFLQNMKLEKTYHRYREA